MGFVFEATQVALRRRVALKFLNDEAAKDKGAVRRFLREARAAAALRSEHVVRIDRKSTRLNSSHGYISYAVFCLKKKKTSDITSRSWADGTSITTRSPRNQSWSGYFTSTFATTKSSNTSPISSSRYTQDYT